MEKIIDTIIDTMLIWAVSSYKRSGITKLVTLHSTPTTRELEVGALSTEALMVPVNTGSTVLKYHTHVSLKYHT
jgi:hypothetical protein